MMAKAVVEKEDGIVRFIVGFCNAFQIVLNKIASFLRKDPTIIQNDLKCLYNTDVKLYLILCIILDVVEPLGSGNSLTP